MLKNTQNLAGIWADDSDNEEDARFKNKKQPKSYTAPIGFVAGGVQQAGKKNGQEKKEDAGSEDEDEKPGTSFKIENSSSDSEAEVVPRRGKFCAHRFFFKCNVRFLT